MSAPNSYGSNDLGVARTESLAYLLSDSENDSEGQRDGGDDDSTGSLRDFIAQDDDSEVAAARRPPFGFHVSPPSMNGSDSSRDRNHSSSDDEHSAASNERRQRERLAERRRAAAERRRAGKQRRRCQYTFEEDDVLNDGDDDGDSLARSPPRQRQRVEHPMSPLLERVNRSEAERAERRHDEIPPLLRADGMHERVEEANEVIIDNMNAEQVMAFRNEIDMLSRQLAQEQQMVGMKRARLQRLMAERQREEAEQQADQDGDDDGNAGSRALSRFRRRLFPNRRYDHSDTGVPSTVCSTYTVYVPTGNDERPWRAHEIRRGDRLPIKKQTYHGGNRALKPFDMDDCTRRIRGMNIDEMVREDDAEDVEDVLSDLTVLIRAFCAENNITTALNRAEGEDPPNDFSYLDGPNNRRLYSVWIRKHAQISAEEYISSGQLGMLTTYREELRPRMVEHHNMIRIIVWRSQRLLARIPRNGVDQAVEMVRESVRSFIRRCELVHTNYCDLCMEFINDTKRHLRERFGSNGFDDFRLPIPPTLYEEVVDPIGDGTEKRNEIMEIKDALRHLAMEQRLRRVIVSKTNTLLFRPVYTKDTRKFCYCYEEDGSVDAWVWSAIDKHFTRREDTLFESTKGTAESVQTYFRLRKGLVDLVTTRHMMSFRNGVYIVPRAEFIPYEEMDDTRLLAPNVFSCTYIDKDFEVHPRLHHVELPFPAPPTPRHTRPERGDTVYDIPTPALDRIMFDQKWPYEVRVAMYVMIGRCLYDQEYLDREQMVVFCTGLRAAGKSTIAKIVSMFYPRHLQCAMGTRGETVFGLQSTVDKFLVTNSEVTKKWNMEPSDFLKIVASDMVTIARKNNMALDVYWRASFLLAGNEFMGWNDDHGATARRLLIFMFTEMIRIDPTLEDQLREELPRIIHKCNRYYLAAACHYGNRSFEWPRYFQEQRLRYMRLSSPIYAFLFSKEVVFGDPQHYYVPYERLMEAFTAFVNRDPELKQNKSNRTDFNVWRSALQFVDVTMGVEVEPCRYPNVDGAAIVKDYYARGIDLAAMRHGH